MQVHPALAHLPAKLALAPAPAPLLLRLLVLLTPSLLALVVLVSLVSWPFLPCRFGMWRYSVNDGSVSYRTIESSDAGWVTDLHIHEIV